MSIVMAIDAANGQPDMVMFYLLPKTKIGIILVQHFCNGLYLIERYIGQTGLVQRRNP